MTVENFNLPQADSETPFQLENALEDNEFVVLLFQRDYFCTNCRNQVQDINERYDEFQGRNVELVSIIPEGLNRANSWKEKYTLRFPVVADADKKVSDSFNQPVKFGVLGNIHDLLGRMPLTMILDGSSREILYRNAGETPTDRPSVDKLLGKIDNCKNS